MNVFIASAGRRLGLLRAFKSALQGMSGRLLAGDMDGLAPALYEADLAFQLPPIHSREYLACLLDIVAEHNVRMLIPTLDPELPLFARACAAFAERGCQVMVSDCELIRVSGDKWETARVFGGAGIAVPRSWLPEMLRGNECDDLPDRLFLKPRDGSASLHAFPVCRGELAESLPTVPHAIIQEELEGDEITVDALLSLSGSLLHYVPRKRIRTIGGESVQGVTLDDAELRPWLIAVLEAIGRMGGRGPITIQAFLTASGPVLTEINPRFGGGIPLTLNAGGHYPEWLIRIVMGECVAPRLGEYCRGLYMTRAYTEHYTTTPLW